MPAGKVSAASSAAVTKRRFMLLSSLIVRGSSGTICRDTGRVAWHEVNLLHYLLHEAHQCRLVRAAGVRPARRAAQLSGGRRGARPVGLGPQPAGRSGRGQARHAPVRPRHAQRGAHPAGRGPAAPDRPHPERGGDGADRVRRLPRGPARAGGARRPAVGHGEPAAEDSWHGSWPCIPTSRSRSSTPCPTASWPPCSKVGPISASPPERWTAPAACPSGRWSRTSFVAIGLPMARLLEDRVYVWRGTRRAAVHRDGAGHERARLHGRGLRPSWTGRAAAVRGGASGDGRRARGRRSWDHGAAVVDLARSWSRAIHRPPS